MLFIFNVVVVADYYIYEVVAFELQINRFSSLRCRSSVFSSDVVTSFITIRRLPIVILVGSTCIYTKITRTRFG
jgi:hypothetical protein